jgi:formylglycine-generating enzyme required for sulfatase activity
VGSSLISPPAEADLKMVKIPAGSYQPLFSQPSSPNLKSKNNVVRVASFYIDRYPVTNAQFLEFVKKNPQWQKSKISLLYAEKNYLAHWPGDLQIKPEQKKQPVTNVSWYAASDYCDALGKSLPTVDQWEYVAGAEFFKKDLKNTTLTQKILDWYSKPDSQQLGLVGSTLKNKYGVYDLHGLIWEWTEDFNSAMVTGESRGDSAIDRKFYCGGGAVGSSDFKDYVAFMRFAMRSSLKAKYTLSTLGFRCVSNH